MDLLARSLSYLLIPLFFVGMLGSLAVVAVTIVQDFHEVLSKDEAVPAPEQTNP
jgi:hypothetical protein